MRNKPFAGFMMQGLTVVDFQTSYSASFTLSEIAEGEWCAAVDRIDVSFGFKNPAQILIAREIPEGSCVFSAVLNHELRHYAIAQESVKTGSRKIGEATEALLTSSFPVKGNSRDGVYDAANAALGGVVNSTSDIAIKWADVQNALLDTKPSYERLKAECP